MDRLERLVNLVAALLDAERPLSREELRERVGGYSDDLDAFRRNFERDKDALRQMGMPLAVEPLDGDHPDAPTGYRVRREQYELPDLGLTEDELTALRVAASAVQIQGGESATASALRKLAGGIIPERPESGARSSSGRAGPASRPGAAGDAGQPAGTEAGPASAPVAEMPGGDAVGVAFGAVSERRRVAFGYRGRRRTIDPWGLAYRGGHWLLSGYDHEREAERAFRLDRVEGSLTALGEAGAFARPEEAMRAPRPPWRLGDEPEVVVTLLVDEVVAPSAVAEVGEDAVVERRPDGSVVLALAVTNRSAFYGLVVGFLDRAEILGPPEVRAEFIESLEALAAP
jgi:proteasome accessory factor B